jgi:hypothetical protein
MDQRNTGRMGAYSSAKSQRLRYQSILQPIQGSTPKRSSCGAMPYTFRKPSEKCDADTESLGIAMSTGQVRTAAIPKGAAGAYS